MYIWAVYTSLVILAVATPLLVIPAKFQNSSVRATKVVLCICFVISAMIALTPEAAVNGAPMHKYGQASIAFLGCNYQISLTTTFCPEGIVSQECYCKNSNALATISHCYKYGHPQEINSFLGMCQSMFNISLTESEFEEAHDNYLRSAKNISEIVDYSPSKLVDFPVRLIDSEIVLFRSAYQNFLGNYDVSVDYGAYVVLYWIVVFTIAAIGNWSKVIFPDLYRNFLTGPFSNWFRRTISLPATRGKYKTNEKKFLVVLDMLVPTRAETIILITFGSMCTYLLVYNINYVEGDPLFHEKKYAILRYVAVRASILTSSLMPLLILFGGRNNFLQWYTRWDYSTFITLHRWLSRIVFVMVMIHVLFYTKLIKERNPDRINEPYIRWGALATWSGILIMIQGLLVLRRKWYEVFLLVHIILAAVFIFGAWLHVKDLYCVWFYYYTSMLWLFDRIVRVGRLFSFGFPEAQVQLIANETLKVIVPKPDHWEAVPGGHVFIHFLRFSCFWQSHPFTYTIDLDDPANIVLFVKVKQGVTSSLYEYLKSHPGKSTSIRVAIEGSYGEKTPASRYDSAIFVAGGNGIPGIYAEVYELAKRSNFTKQNLKLTWVIREYRSLLWFYDELVSLKGTNIDTTICVTKPNSHGYLEEYDGPLLSSNTTRYNTFESRNLTEMGSMRPEIISAIKTDLSHIQFREGRPHIDTLVKQATKESPGSACFVTCGHPVMVDELRSAVVENINNSDRKRVDYFEQLQVWA
ncbi:ferric reductase (FRE9 FRE5 FRE6 FRE4 FRE7) [Scheffersomyces stipitis CBS 6054]|uniref:Ferric reductase (FRE9 FRE5 FRE6 FRE4 FRE7) n=1 Tax=Scheffersomyces stipitis (strain ATCC 58785 / CBS 6054 / NBRC 10063 / NRRL Y-11545) TaxID=322104 RepID=A3GG54_PICST|nr:ferric reductase (FRE9 FRE5 FRE6 FRE4 FRE7) [Scheffersomyces stipitis CBS 6054]EAZ63876.2 ferric reductase (FRE9 FRE5 FRE6 FRE4 FRE7) [Scheffersomyces stipitis CBS 6054]